MSSSFDQINKDGFIITHGTMFNNLLMREISINLSVQCALLYIMMLSHRNMESNKCFPSRDTLARETGQSVPTIARQMKSLEDSGYIITHSGAKGRANYYYFPKESFYDGEGRLASKKGNVFNKDIDKEIKWEKELQEYIESCSIYTVYDDVQEFTLSKHF